MLRSILIESGISCANRLLVASLCIRFRRTCLVRVGFFISAHIVVSQLFYFANTDEFSQMLSFAREYETGLARRFIEILFEHPLIQGLIAALVVIFAAGDLKRRLPEGRPVRAFSLTIGLILLVLSAGCLSSFISHGAAERSTAQWLYRDVLRGESLNGDFVGSDFLKESASRFTSIGAKVIKVESDKGRTPYTLRHSAVTELAKEGDPFTLMKISGHSDIKMLSRYVHPELERIRDVFRKKCNPPLKEGEGVTKRDTPP